LATGKRCPTGRGKVYRDDDQAARGISS